VKHQQTGNITELQVLAHTQQIFYQPKLSTRLSRTELKQPKLKDRLKQMANNKLWITQSRHTKHTQFSPIEFIKWRGTTSNM